MRNNRFPITFLFSYNVQSMCQITSNVDFHCRLYSGTLGFIVCMAEVIANRIKKLHIYFWGGGGVDIYQFKISFSWTYFFASNLTFLIYLYSNTFRLVLNHLLQSISPFAFHIGRTLLIFISYVPFIYLNPVFQGSTTETILLVIVLPISCFSWINM